MFISLKRWPSATECPRPASSIACAARLTRVNGISVFLSAAQDIRVGARQSDSDYQFTLWSPDIGDLYAWVPKVVDQISAIPGLSDVSTDREQGGLQASIAINRQARPPPRRAHPGHQQRAQQCLRAATGVGHLHTAQPVSRGSGGRSALPAGPD
jgi:hypothetical protein